MRVAMLNITGGGISGGYRSYLRNVVPRLACYDGVGALLCAAPSTLDLRSWFPQLPVVTFIACKPFRFLRHQLDRGSEEVVRRFTPNVILLPVERFVRFPGVPIVTMVQNMGPLVPVAGNPWSERMRYVAQRVEARIAVRYANHVIAPTNFVREFLVHRWRVPAQNITTIHYGAPSPHGAAERRPSSIPSGWDDHFLFTAGSIEPYRGLEDLLQAVCLLHKHRESPLLVIAGYARLNMARYQQRLVRWIERHGLQDRIRLVGTLQEEEMAWCYRHCTAFVMTSRVESFGLIGLEALTYGCACIVANNPPLPEIFGDAAEYYRSGDGEELARAIVRTLRTSYVVRAAVSQHAREHAAQFSWDRFVDHLVAVLRDAAFRVRS